jgi:hypothetical protein
MGDQLTTPKKLRTRSRQDTAPTFKKKTENWKRNNDQLSQTTLYYMRYMLSSQACLLPQRQNCSLSLVKAPGQALTPVQPTCLEFRENNVKEAVKNDRDSPQLTHVQFTTPL